MYRDRFGYLPYRFTAEWNGGSVDPAPEFGEAQEWVEGAVHRDGYLYPPIVQRQQRSPDKVDESHEGGLAEREALLHRLPVTHEIRMPDAEEGRQAVRKGAGGFVMHFLGFLFGYLCQFEDWWVDRRVRMRPDTDASPHPTHAGNFLQTALGTWSRWDEDTRALATNALFFSLRSTGYEWEWERFQASYQVTDAGWNLARRTGQVVVESRPRHDERIQIICEQLGLHWDEELVGKIVDLRSELFHEARWHGKQPTEAGERWLYHMDRYLRNCNVRLFLALLGIESDFIHTAWKGLGPVGLEPRG